MDSKKERNIFITLIILFCLCIFFKGLVMAVIGTIIMSISYSKIEKLNKNYSNYFVTLFLGVFLMFYSLCGYQTQNILYNTLISIFGTIIILAIDFHTFHKNLYSKFKKSLPKKEKIKSKSANILKNYDELMKLNELLKNNIITKEEFEVEKEKILNK